MRKIAPQSLILPALVVLVGVGAFGLGRLSAVQEGREQLRIHPPGEPNALAVPVPAPPASQTAAAVAGIKKYVASRNGTRYYAAGCAGASRIKTENEVWFGSAEDAQAAGYTAAANCSN